MITINPFNSEVLDTQAAVREFILEDTFIDVITEITCDPGYPGTWFVLGEIAAPKKASGKITLPQKVALVVYMNERDYEEVEHDALQAHIATLRRYS